MSEGFSKAERIDYARRLERLESLKAEKRMRAGKADPMENFPQGTTRDIIAEKLNIGSGKQYEKEKYIVDNKDSLSPEDFADRDDGKLSTNKVLVSYKVIRLYSISERFIIVSRNGGAIHECSKKRRNLHNR